MHKKRFSSRYLYLSLATLAALLLVPVLASAADLLIKVTTDKTSYQVGQQVVVTALVTTANGKPANSAKRKEVSVFNPSGSEVVKTSMASKGNGTYTYTYTLGTAAPTGTWRVAAVFETANAGGTASANFVVGTPRLPRPHRQSPCKPHLERRRHLRCLPQQRGSGCSRIGSLPVEGSHSGHCQPHCRRRQECRRHERLLHQHHRQLEQLQQVPRGSGRQAHARRIRPS